MKVREHTADSAQGAQIPPQELRVVGIARLGAAGAPCRARHWQRAAARAAWPTWAPRAAPPAQSPPWKSPPPPPPPPPPPRPSPRSSGNPPCRSPPTGAARAAAA
eukprot:1185124-Prorocentrum_minimum.AAC.1